MPRVLPWALSLLLTPTARASAQLSSAPARDRARLAELLGRPDSARTTRAASTISAELVGPVVRFVTNSRLPWSQNDGPLWAGRGLNASATVGGRLRWHPGRAVGLDLTVAPTVWYAQNRPFPILAGRDSSRSAFASPFHSGAASADVPIRFGDRPWQVLDPGLSAVVLRVHAVAVGATTAPEWWGPGLRTALVLSDNAAGVPRAFVRTARPMRTPIGSVEGQLTGGVLTRSLYFGERSGDDYRALSAARLSVRLAGVENLTLGLARSVLVPIGGRSDALAHAGDVLTRWNQVPQRPDSAGLVRATSDQLLTLSWRWVLPRSGFESYGEWGRAQLPRSLRELLVAPQQSQAYVLGGQWATARAAATYRVQGELSYLEQSALDPMRPSYDWYTGRAAAAGYTQRGQVLGAWSGPGSSTQFVAVDRLVRGWQAGAVVGRVRWDNDALYREENPTFRRHDVTYYGGLRGGRRIPGFDLSAEGTYGRRANYLFQNGSANPGGVRTVDLPNVSLALSLTPR